MKKVALSSVTLSKQGFESSRIERTTKKLTMLMLNVEALTRGETLPGLVCYYKGTTKLVDLIPCTATYPNIGKCGERVKTWYSNDSAQCYE